MLTKLSEKNNFKKWSITIFCTISMFQFVSFDGLHADNLALNLSNESPKGYFEDSFLLLSRFISKKLEECALPIPISQQNSFFLQNPTAEVFAIQPSCSDGVPNQDGYLQISATTNGDRYHYSTGNTFDDDGGTKTYANASVIGTLPHITTQDLPNPTVSQTYTMRVYNGADNFFVDKVVTMNNQDCTIGCDCEEYIYLNEQTGGGAVHKFLVTTDSLVEQGSPWFSNSAASESLSAPHGLGVDLNGFLYIGETSLGSIRRLNCEGNIFPVANFEINDGGYNIGSIGNTIYINSRTQSINAIYAYDICTGNALGFYCLDGINPTNWRDWGFSISNDGTFYVTNDFGTTRQNHLYKFTKETATLNPIGASNTVCVDPFISQGDGNLLIGESELPNFSCYGVTSDGDKNIYLVEKTRNGDPNFTSAGLIQRASRIIKYDSTGTVLAISPYDNQDGDGGYFNAIGIVYSEVTNQIYVSTESPQDDCVSIFDTDLAYLGAGVPATGTGSASKGIAISKECCPNNNNFSFDTTLCNAVMNEDIFLANIINCSGVICEGMWQADPSNTGVTFNDCNNSLQINSVTACGIFTLESDGVGENLQCGAFKMTVKISVGNISAPVIQGDQTVCVGDDPAPITISTLAVSDNPINYQWQSSSTSCTTGFVDIIGATDTSYDPSTGATSNTYYRVVANAAVVCNSGMCADTSNCVTVTVQALPSASASAANPTCPVNSKNANDDGTVTLIDFDLTERFAYTIGTSYTGSATFATGSSAIPPDGIIINNLPNPSASETYTIRIFNDQECFTDRQIMIANTECRPIADYSDYLRPGSNCIEPVCHVVSDDLYLGSAVTVDTTNTNNGNESANTDIDDGIAFSPNMKVLAGSTLRIPVSIYNNTGINAFLKIWIDWNGDGDFDDTNEYATNNTYPSTGTTATTVKVPISIPTDAQQNQDIALRVRLSTDDTNSADPCGNGICALDGEVEDYLIQVKCTTPVCTSVQLMKSN